MDNAGAQKKQVAEIPSVVRALWNPFGFMQEMMFGWGRGPVRPLFEVKETNDTYVCRAQVQLTLPDQADLAHAKAVLDNGELTLVVPKAVVAAPEPERPPARRAKASGNGGGPARRRPRRGTRAPARRG